jgi:hypothetical protein
MSDKVIGEMLASVLKPDTSGTHVFFRNGSRPNSHRGGSKDCVSCSSRVPAFPWPYNSTVTTSQPGGDVSARKRGSRSWPDDGTEMMEFWWIHCAVHLHFAVGGDDRGRSAVRGVCLSARMGETPVGPAGCDHNVRRHHAQAIARPVTYAPGLGRNGEDARRLDAYVVSVPKWPHTAKMLEERASDGRPVVAGLAGLMTLCVTRTHQ